MSRGLYAQGVRSVSPAEGGGKVRKALDLTNWDAASDLIAGWAASGEIGLAKAKIPSVQEAVRLYMADCETRHLAPASLYKLRLVLDKQLLPFCRSRGYSKLKSLGVNELRSFRETWKDGAYSSSKKLERLRTFFKFCVSSGWIKVNPVLAIKPPKVSQSPTLPFTSEEVDRIILACDKFPIQGIYGVGNRHRLKAMVLLLRYSGLRIGDAVGLRHDQIRDGKLFLYTQKTGTPVVVPLPSSAVEAIAQINSDRDCPFWSGNGDIKSAVSDWQRSLRKLFKIAKVEDAHPHRFRDTFAVNLLVKGVPLSDVSILLGHSSQRITEKHYRAVDFRETNSHGRSR